MGWAIDRTHPMFYTKDNVVNIDKNIAISNQRIVSLGMFPLKILKLIQKIAIDTYIIGIKM